MRRWCLKMDNDAAFFSMAMNQVNSTHYQQINFLVFQWSLILLYVLFLWLFLDHIDEELTYKNHHKGVKNGFNGTSWSARYLINIS